MAADGYKKYLFSILPDVVLAANLYFDEGSESSLGPLSLSAPLSVVSGGAFTIELEFSSFDITSTSFPAYRNVIFSTRKFTNTSGFALYLTRDPGEVNYGIVINVRDTAVFTVSGPNVWEPNTDYHLILVNDPDANEARVYLDGSLLFVAPAIVATQSPDSYSCRIGAEGRNDGSPEFTYPYSGRITNFAVFDRVLLETEVSDNYDAWLNGSVSKDQTQASKVSGIVQIDGTPAQRTVRAFGYNTTIHDIEGESVNLSKSLGHSISDPDTGEYTIDLLAGYDRRIFVVAFDDYGADFAPNKAVAVGDRIHPTTPNGHVWECTGAGTLPSEEPTWIVDTETAQLYGTASMIAKPFYRPMVHGPVVPEVTEYVPPTLIFRESITAGSNFTLAINKDGIIDGWGKDESLILSNIPPTSDAIEVVAGHNHALALLSDGSVVGWGNNINNKSTPPADLGPCKKIAAGPEISAAIREDGSVVVWGDSGYNVQVVPAEVVDPIDIACAYRTVVALLPDGSLVAWGQDYQGLVSGAPDITDGIQVVGGRYTLAVLRAGGVVNEWGSNYGAPSSPDTGIKFIAGGGYSFGAPKADQSILTWGNTGAPGQALDIERLAFGSYDSSHGAAILADGTVFCWGDNDNGQCDAPAGFVGLQPQNPERFS